METEMQKMMSDGGRHEKARLICRGAEIVKVYIDREDDD
jgi:hypothetical protein